MKAASAGMIAHIAQGQTSLTTVLTIMRSDGQVIVVTEHDEDILFDSAARAALNTQNFLSAIGHDVTALSYAGFSKFNLNDKANLDASNIQLQGMIDSQIFTRKDLGDRRFDSASVQVFMVNWSDLSQGDIILHTGEFGQAEIEEFSFKMGLFGLAKKLEDVGGETCTPTCRVDFGSPRCAPGGVLANGTTIDSLMQTGTVIATDGFRVITVSGIGALPDFGGGGSGGGAGPVSVSVNPPIFIQYRRTALVLVSCPDPNYVGCQLAVLQWRNGVAGLEFRNTSADGTQSLNISGNAPMGVITADWPAANDPDTAHDLLVDLTLGGADIQLANPTVDTASPTIQCYVEAAAITTAPNEIISYGVAVSTGSHLFTLSASGTIRRALASGANPTAAPGVGVFHPAGSRFAVIDSTVRPGLPSPVGGYLIPPVLAPYFKFPTIASDGSIQPVASATMYGYTPLNPIFLTNPSYTLSTRFSAGITGAWDTVSPYGLNDIIWYNPVFGATTATIYRCLIPGRSPTSVVPGTDPTVWQVLQTNVPLNQLGRVCVFQVNPTTIVQFAAVGHGEGGFYFIHYFTIPAPTSPTTYYVTIHDPYYDGDTFPTIATDLAAGGSGYAVGDTGIIDQASFYTALGITSPITVTSNYVVDAVDGGGAVTAYHLSNDGFDRGYSLQGSGFVGFTATPTATGGAQPGSGTGFQVVITGLGNPALASLTDGTCQTSNALVGVLGEVYMGSVVAVPSGLAVGTPGGH